MDEYRNLEYFFAAYSLMLLIVCGVFGYLTLRIRKLAADLEELKKEQGAGDA